MIYRPHVGGDAQEATMTQEVSSNNDTVDTLATARGFADVAQEQRTGGASAARELQHPDQNDDRDDDAQEADTERSDDWRDGFDPEKAQDKIRKLNREARAMRDRAKAAEAKVQSQDDLQRERDTLAQASLRYEVALDLGLPKQLAMRLQGGTREEMIQDAQQLLELVGPKAPPTARPVPVQDLQPVAVEKVDTDLAARGARMFKR